MRSAPVREVSWKKGHSAEPEGRSESGGGAFLRGSSPGGGPKGTSTPKQAPVPSAWPPERTCAERSCPANPQPGAWRVALQPPSGHTRTECLAPRAGETLGVLVTQRQPTDALAPEVLPSQARLRFRPDLLLLLYTRLSPLPALFRQIKNRSAAHSQR